MGPALENPLEVYSRLLLRAMAWPAMAIGHSSSRVVLDPVVEVEGKVLVVLGAVDTQAH